MSERLIHQLAGEHDAAAAAALDRELAQDPALQTELAWWAKQALMIAELRRHDSLSGSSLTSRFTISDDTAEIGSSTTNRRRRKVRSVYQSSTIKPGSERDPRLAAKRDRYRRQQRRQLGVILIAVALITGSFFIPFPQPGAEPAYLASGVIDGLTEGEPIPPEARIDSGTTELVMAHGPGHRLMLLDRCRLRLGTSEPPWRWELERGDLRVEWASCDTPITLSVPGGWSISTSDATFRVVGQTAPLALQVSAGTVELRRHDGEPRQLAAGAAVDLPDSDPP